MQKFPMKTLQIDMTTVASAASREPVMLTHYNKPKFVLMAIQDFEKLREKDPRKAYFVEEIPDTDFDAMVKAAEKFVGSHSDD